MASSRKTVVLRLTPEIYEDLKMAAEVTGSSMNAWAEDALTAQLSTQSPHLNTAAATYAGEHRRQVRTSLQRVQRRAIEDL